MSDLPEILRAAAGVRSDADAKHMLRAAAEIDRLRRELAEIRAAIFPIETDATRGITDLAGFLTDFREVESAESVANAEAIAAMKARAESAEADALRWKAHHDDQVRKKRDVSEKLSIVIEDARALARECEDTRNAIEQRGEGIMIPASSARSDNSIGSLRITKMLAARKATDDRNAMRWA